MGGRYGVALREGGAATRPRRLRPVFHGRSQQTRTEAVGPCPSARRKLFGRLRRDRVERALVISAAASDDIRTAVPRSRLARADS